MGLSTMLDGLVLSNDHPAMVLSTMSINEEIELCIFDLLRGQQEGQELDKILFFLPPDSPYSAQLSLIGLCEGMIAFTRIFSPNAACEVIEADKHTHVFYQAEPDIWIVMVLGKNKDVESCRRFDALCGIMKEIHSLFTMFNGSIRSLLEKQPSGELARSYLYTFVPDYLTNFSNGKKIQMPSFRDCLREQGTVQMLTISRDAAVEVQSLVTVIGLSCGGNTMCKSLILFHDLLVSTTISPDDTANLYAYALLRLIPNALSASKSSSWSSYFLRGSSTTNVAVAGSMENSGYLSHESGGLNQRFHAPRPMQREKWLKGKDGFLITDAWGVEVGNQEPILPTVLLQHAEERMYVYVYQHKSLTVIVLIPASSLMNGGQEMTLIKQQLLENASQKISNIEEKLSRGWGGENAYHVRGYRYLIVDNDRSVSRSSPPGKVTTLTKDSLLSLNKLREEIDIAKAKPQGTNDPEQEKDMEICIRAKNNAWVIAKISRGKELYMVLEKAEETLLYASESVEKFSNRYCDGAFSLD